MRQYVATLASALLGGCSLIYNPNNIEKPPADAADAQVDAMALIDARIDAPPLADANPAALTVLDASPSVIFEGQGVDNSAPAMLVISGHHFIAGATVTLSPSTDLTVGTPTVSTNGDFIAVPITAAVNTGTNTGTVPLTITVNESGATAQDLTDKVSLTYLPQLTGSTLALPLAERYSQVAFNAGPAISGTSNVIIRSMSSITCGTGNGAFNANGAAPASTKAAGAAGPGGCAGGAEGTSGGCAGLVGGGGAGGAGNGGGGGGFGTAGAAGGGGANGGTLGVAHGAALIVSYAGAQADGSDRNQASGGGGGSTDGVNLGSGGGGGGGGGTVEMTAGGDIKCGAIDVSGGAGATGTVAVTGGSGGGGGGAGGLVVLRTRRGSITNASVIATGGSPGGGGGTGTGGGNGGAGRVRVDAPGSSLPSTNPAGALHRGLSFATTTMDIYTIDNPMVTLLGTAGDVFDMYVIDSLGVEHTGEPQNQTIDGTGMKTMQVTLLPGYNRLCATVRPGARDKNDPFSLADTCVDVAYLP